MADFGGGPGYYTRAFRAAGARPVLIDASYAELTSRGPADPAAVVGLAEQSPLSSESVDVAFSSNLLEHVADLAAVADEIVRVVRPGGLRRPVLHRLGRAVGWPRDVTVALPGRAPGGTPLRAQARASAEERLRREHVRRAREDGAAVGAISHDLEILEERPRYLPPGSRVLLKVPGLREVATWNLWQVLRKRG